MSAQIQRLEALLQRVQLNAKKPRAARTVAAPAVQAEPIEVEEVPAAELEELAPMEVVEAAPPDLPITEVEHEVPPMPERRPIPPPPAAAAPAEVEELDMMDAEIVEVAADAADTASLEADLSSPIDEPVPESAPRPAVQLAADEISEIEERYPDPVKTPPPESGRQAVTGAPGAAYAEPLAAREVDLGGGVDELLEADLSGGAISKSGAMAGPTMEQLGDTVELEGADAPGDLLELAAPAEAEAVAAEDEPDALELSLPRGEFAGAYDAKLAPPATAAADLARHHREQAAKAHVTAPASVSSPLSAAPHAVPVMSKPITVDRPTIAGPVHAAEVIVSTVAQAPEAFIELLDASLSL